MYKSKPGNVCPVFSWLQNVEESVQKQIDNLSNLPFAFHHVAIMPDCHMGYGMPIGGVLATEGIIIPNCVGVDIGCGMCAVKTSLIEIDEEILKKIMGAIRRIIPLGFNHHKEKQNESVMPFRTLYDEFKIVAREYESALKQIGTLGGGNHFIEIQKGLDDHIWIMVHSGSRNIGKQVADHYNKLAVELNEKWYSSVPKEWELAFLPLDSNEGQLYLQEMQYCVDFALASRKLMMDRICDTFIDTFNWQGEPHHFDNMINIAHNYARMESHFNHNVMVHRKGATLAREDTVGIIPGSMGTKSYIVKGKGNKDSFESCSHGAGRSMGRKEAIRTLNFEDEVKKMNDQGIIHGMRNRDDLDEAPGSYKDIDIVMENQKDLVDILVELRPLAVIKG